MVLLTDSPLESLTGATLLARYAYAMNRHSLSLIAAAALLVGCSQDSAEDFTVAATPEVSPAGPASGEPFLSSIDGVVYMSWLEKTEPGHDLRFSRFDGASWDEPITVASSDRFFVNWADFPSIRPGPDGTLWAHWLQRGAAGGYDYGVRIAHSSDQGRTWSEPWTPHDDTSATEHGFVSATTDGDQVGFVWLDGRKYADLPDGTPGSKEMTVRYRTVSSDGTPGPEMLIDGRVCDCCQTATGMTSAGPVVAYRNRTEAEIRDIYVARMVDGTWLEGAPVHDDGWEIAGCPVNGPALTASGEEVAVAWFTGAGDVPRTNLAFSKDGGASFGAPIVIDDGSPVGRVDLLQAGDGSVVVVWLEGTGGEGAEVKLRRVTPDGDVTESVAVTTTSAERPSGFPRLAQTGDGSLLLAWSRRCV